MMDDKTLEALKQLDDRIESSVVRIQQLQRENQELAKQLAETERRFGELAEKLKSAQQQHEGERSQVKERLEKILARFDTVDLGLLR